MVSTRYGEMPALVVSNSNTPPNWVWNGFQWSQPAELQSGPAIELDDGTGPALYMNWFSWISKWNGQYWTPIAPSGACQSMAVPSSLAYYNDGSGMRLYAACGNAVRRWNGQLWETIGSSFTGTLQLITVYESGLYVAGTFQEINGISAFFRFAKWNGLAWEHVPELTGGDVKAMTVYDDGSGAALFVAGTFTSVGGLVQPFNRIAKWNGQTWTALGSGLTGNGDSTRVKALAVFDEGGNPALYVSGDFSLAGGVPAGGLAKWNGSDWTGILLGGYAEALTVFDDGARPALYVRGDFNEHVRKYGCPEVVGDINGDGIRDGLDIVSFVWVWFDPSSATPQQCRAMDGNLNGAIDSGDLPAFLDRLLNWSSP